MTETNRTPMRWTRESAALVAAVCLVAGIGGGWSIRGSRTAAASNVSTSVPSAVAQPASLAPHALTPAQLKEMADSQAAPLLDKLKFDPNNPDLLAGIGNLYYDAQQYPIAVDYYARTLKFRPADASVRTDMGTAFWFMGNADRAIAEFNKALTYVPDNPNTLFNRGLVLWKGKTDAAGAIADWGKLLAVNPEYQGKAQVEQLLDDAKSHISATQAVKAN
jgi:tetratricopeptide (TPR) repeat protein